MHKRGILKAESLSAYCFVYSGAVTTVLIIVCLESPPVFFICLLIESARQNFPHSGFELSAKWVPLLVVLVEMSFQSSQEAVPLLSGEI